MEAKGMRTMGGGLPDLLKGGSKHLSGLEEAVHRNIDAVKKLSAITRTSLGPNGMNKLVINHLDKLIVTNDAATIVKELEVMHPAAKIVVMGAAAQEEECGDGTNLVATLAGELLTQADSLLRLGLHPSEVAAGYKAAHVKISELLEGLVVETMEDVTSVESIARALKPVIASKQFGYEDLLAPIFAEACSVGLRGSGARVRLNADNVRVCKVPGAGIAATHVVRGLVLQREALGLVKHVEDAKLLVLGTSLEASDTETKGTVLIESAEELMEFNKGEERLMEDQIRSIAESGVNVIVSNGAVSEMALHFCERYGLMVLKVISKFDLRRICRATGATALVRVGAPLPEEMGTAAYVGIEEVGGTRLCIFRQTEDAEVGQVSTIVLRGASPKILDDLERAVDDSVHTVQQMCKDARFVPGAGAVELELARQLRLFAKEAAGLDMYAIESFARALEVVPRTLLENAGVDVVRKITELRALHAGGDKPASGVDGETGEIVDTAAAGIWDTMRVKKQTLRTAIEAACLMLRIDDVVSGTRKSS
eukprot:PLAT5019.4.p2 GENE.PLAT5019.4~~PLAT5019.4.p2  ORF type:complete len:539 (-),score=319.74 PLAT5019.4:152-1768(-)